MWISWPEMKEIGSKVGQKPNLTPNFCNFFSPSLSLPFQPLADATISSSATSSITRSQHNYRSATIGLSLSPLCYPIFSTAFLSLPVFGSALKPPFLLQSHQAAPVKLPATPVRLPATPSAQVNFVSHPGLHHAFCSFPSIRANKTWINSHLALLAFANSYRDRLDLFPA